MPYSSSEIDQVEYYVSLEDGTKKLILSQEDGDLVEIDVSDDRLIRPNLVFDGDSQVVGGSGVLSITEYGDSMPALAISGIDPRTTLANFGVGGQTVAMMITDAATQVDPLLAVLAQNVVVVWAGTNDLYFGANAAATYNNIVAYHTARRAAGWKTIVYTILPRTNVGTPAAYEADRVTVNTNIRANWATFADVLCDIALDTRLQTPGDTRYFYDLVHCTLAGRLIVSRLTKKALAAINVITSSNQQLNGLVSPATAKSQVGLGEGALIALTTGTANLAMGGYAGSKLTTGSNNVTLGTAALQAATTALQNVAIATNALYSDTTGANNVAIGMNALFSNTTGVNGTAVGVFAALAATAGSIVALGYGAAYSPGGLTANATTTGLRQTNIGYETGQSSATQRNDGTALGYRALFGANDATAIGSGAQALHTSSVALGKGAVTTADNQVMIGSRDIEITDITKGVIQRSPDGTRYRISVANGGALTAVAVI